MEKCMILNCQNVAEFKTKIYNKIIKLYCDKHIKEVIIFNDIVKIEKIIYK